jgi:hypothetical protein
MAEPLDSHHMTPAPDGDAAPRDLFDDGEDWIDDEGAAPDVIS